MIFSFATLNAEYSLALDALMGPSTYFLPVGEPTGVVDSTTVERWGLDTEIGLGTIASLEVPGRVSAE
jgi:hypothetical protein